PLLGTFMSASGQFFMSADTCGDRIAAARGLDDGVDTAEGYRFLSRALRYLLEKSLDGDDVDFPRLVRSSHETLKLLSDSPDYYYRLATIDGRHDYRLRGRRGTADLIALSSYGEGGHGSECHGLLQEPQLQIEPDGSFDVILSAQFHPGNWLPLQENSTFIQLREVYPSRHRDSPSVVSINRVGGPAVPAPYDSARLLTGLRRAATQLTQTTGLISAFAPALRERAFCCFDDDQSLWRAAGANPDTRYAQGYWELGQGEALVVECAIPACNGFSFQINNRWAESLDYSHHTVYRTNHSSTIRSDGSVRYVIAEHYPEIEADWLDPAGHRAGTMVWKWNGALSQPVPTARVMRT
ncbi:hypothetical protein, partial [[Mycobacterium] vasticus]